jgi:hypothetical protein
MMTRKHRRPPSSANDSCSWPPSSSRVRLLTPRALCLTLATIVSVACVRESRSDVADTVMPEANTAVTPQSAAQTPQPTDIDTTRVRQVLLSADSSAPAPLTCGPTTFGVGDTITIRMWTPHGHYLTVTRTDRISYNIVYPPVKSKPNLSLIPSDEFVSVASLRLPADIRAVPYVYGRDTILEAVFGAPGKYLLQMGDNIGTDYGTPPSSCDLTFTGASRNYR